MAAETVEDARSVNHVISICGAQDTACMIALAVGDLATAEAAVTTLLELSTKHALGFWVAWGHGLEGQLLIKRGAVAAGVQRLRTALDELRNTGFVLRRPVILGALAEGLAANGQPAQGLLVINDALEQCERTGERWNMPDLLSIKAEILVLDGTQQFNIAAESHYLQSLELARRQAALSWELRCAIRLARLWRDQSRSHELRALLAPLYDRFTEGFETADMRAAKALLEAP